MGSLAVIIGLLAAGVLLVLAELIIPGGVVGAVGILLMVIGVVMGFNRDTGLGVGLLIGVILFSLAALWGWVRYFPGSRLGKKMFLARDAKEWRGYDSRYGELLNRQGRAYTVLRPAGTAMFGDRRYDVVSEGGVIEKDEPITVVRVEGNRIVVARVETPQAAPGT